MPAPSTTVRKVQWLAWPATAVAGLAILGCAVGLIRPYDVKVFERSLWPALLGVFGFVLLAAAASMSRWPRVARESLRFLAVAGALLALVAVLASMAFSPPTEDVSVQNIPETDLSVAVVSESGGLLGGQPSSVVVRGALGPFVREQELYRLYQCPATVNVGPRTVVVEVLRGTSDCTADVHTFVVAEDGWSMTGQ